MKIELEDISHSKDRKDWTYDHDCTLKVKKTDNNGSVTETEEYGYMIQGEDMIFLNSENVYLPNLPTEHKDIAGAFDEVLGKLQDGGGGDEWQPPDWWIPVPEPEPYDVYILIQVRDVNKKFSVTLADQQGNEGNGIVHCDWGDGTQEIFTTQEASHIYTEAGQFLIRITGDTNAFFFKKWGILTTIPLIVKTGSEIAFQIDVHDYLYNPLFSNTFIRYIKINHSEGIPVGKRSARYFLGCMCLQKLELAKKISGELPQLFFQGCYALKNLERFIDCDSITEIGDNAFGHCYNLLCAELPNCTAIGANGFVQCTNLQEITTAENCTFGTNCFQGCYSLYPRPDGSTN